MNTTSIPTEHLETIDRLFRGGDKILSRLKADEFDILHAAVGISTEAAELMEAVILVDLTGNFGMAHLHVGAADRTFRSPWEGANEGDAGIDIDNVKEELGDHLFYEGALRAATGLFNLGDPWEDGCWPLIWKANQGPLTLANIPTVGRKWVLRDLVMVHCAVAGQILDVAKKVVMYGSPLSTPSNEWVTLRGKLLSHLMDDCWVIESIAMLIGTSEDDLRRLNIEKLETGENARYKDGYSDEAARKRADKEDPNYEHDRKFVEEVDRIAAPLPSPLRGADIPSVVIDENGEEGSK